MVEARAVIGVADIHAGPLAHGIEALEDLDAVGTMTDASDLRAGSGMKEAQIAVEMALCVSVAVT